MWLSLAFLSALLLGFYEIFKKTALDGNAVIPVLFLNTVFCSLLFLPVIVLSYCFPEVIRDTMFYVPRVPFSTHLLIILKSVIVLSSWIFAYFSTKHLPITIAGTIRATQPVLTLLGALLVFGERLNLYQWIGVLLALLSFYMLSAAGKKEGINFKHNRWIFFLVLATLFGATSGLYDKYLMMHVDRMTVQVWYTWYQIPMMGAILLFVWYPKRKQSTPFQWRSSIFFISFFLVIADFVYFYALSFPDSMISIVSMVRRSNVVVSFIAGAIIFREKNLKSKAFDLLLVLIGMLFLYIGSKV